MNEWLMTRRGDRRDVLVAAIEQGRLNPPTEYIGHRVFPLDMKGEKAGTFYYQELTADSAAQTSRAVGAALDTTYLATVPGTYACTPYEKRYGVPDDEVKSYGTIERADMAGVSAAARSCYRAHENNCGAAVIDATAYGNKIALPSGAVLEGLSKAAQNVKRYPGWLTLVCSEDWYLDFIAQSDVKAAIQATFGNSALVDLNRMLAKDPRETIKFMIAVIQFNEILIGDNEHWQIAGREDAASVMRLPRPAEITGDMDMKELYKERAIYGITHVWLPDPTNPELIFAARSFYDDDVTANKYDCRAWLDLDELNAGAKQLVSLPSQQFATTTSA